jgi:hypothetical protein
MLRSAEAAALKWEGISFQWDTTNRLVAMKVTLLVSMGEVYKTHANAVTFHLNARPQEQGFCVVHLMWIWRQYMLSTQGELPSLVFPWSVDQCRRDFKEIAHKVLKCAQRDIGLHSLRAGAASDAEEQGLTLSDIMFMGRWRSPTVLVYLRNGQKKAHELGLSWNAGTMIRPSMFS